MFVFGQQPIDPEVLAHHRLEMQDQNLAFWRFVESLDEQQLVSMLDLLSYVVHHNEFGIHIHGVISGKLKWKYEYCFCEAPLHKQEKHTNEILDAAKESSNIPSKTPVKEEEYEPDVTLLLPSGLEEEDVYPREPDPRTEDALLPRYFSMADAELLKEYNMERNTDPQYAREVRCKKCKSKYDSMADRLVRPPSECHFCQILEAHGGINPWS